MFAFIASIRRQTKLGIAILVWDLMLLIAILLAMTAGLQQIMHPAIAVVGALWILFTSGAIWHSGGVIVDTALAARILNTEIGKEFTHALNIFFMLGATTVVFFFLFPVWKFWAGTFILPVLLVGLFTSANLAGEKTNWNMFYKAYSLIIAALLLAFIFIGLTGWRPENTDFSGFINSWISRLMLLGTVLIILSFMPFIPQGFKGLLKFLGSAMLIISLVLIIFPEISPAKAGFEKKALSAGTSETCEIFLASVPPGGAIKMTRFTEDAPTIKTSFWDQSYLFDSRIPQTKNFWKKGKEQPIFNSDNTEMKVYALLKPGQDINEIMSWTVFENVRQEVPYILEDDE
jgi:hypothetical protein